MFLFIYVVFLLFTNILPNKPQDHWKICKY